MGLNINKVNLLPVWCIADKYPAFYDTESATAIEQTAKLHGAMRTLQTEYNEMVTNVNATITAFINDVNADQEEFENHINKIVHDYIAMLDEKIKMQDSVIEDSIIYIKNNLSVAVEELLNKLVQTGELKNIITTYEYDSASEKLILKMGGNN